MKGHGDEDAKGSPGDRDLGLAVRAAGVLVLGHGVRQWQHRRPAGVGYEGGCRGGHFLVLGFGGVAIAIEFNVLGGTGVRRQYGGDAGGEN